MVDFPSFSVFCPRRTKARSAASIILRGANDFMVDEMERSMHDALCVVKRVLESKMVVPGGGAVEAALSIYLENFATSLVRTNFDFYVGAQYKLTPLNNAEGTSLQRDFVASDLFNIVSQWFCEKKSAPYSCVPILTSNLLKARPNVHTQNKFWQ